MIACKCIGVKESLSSPNRKFKSRLSKSEEIFSQSCSSSRLETQDGSDSDSEMSQFVGAVRLKEINPHFHSVS